MDRLLVCTLAPKTDDSEEKVRVSSMQDDNTDVAGSNQKPTVTQAQAEAAAAGALLTLTQFLQGQGP